MNCKQGFFNAQMRWIERSLYWLDNPKIKGMIISREAKTKELNSLIGKLAEAKQNCQTESDQEWLNSVGQNLKQRVMAEINPPLIVGGDPESSPATFL